jgi:hypothetical protein
MLTQSLCWRKSQRWCEWRLDLLSSLSLLCSLYCWCQYNCDQPPLICFGVCWRKAKIYLPSLYWPCLVRWKTTEFKLKYRRFNPFTAEVAIMLLLGSAPMSHLCDQKRRSKVTCLSDLMTLFIDLGCLNCKQAQRALNVFKNTLNWLKIDLVNQKFNWLECGNFSQDAGTPGTERFIRFIAFLQLAVKGLSIIINITWCGFQT